jgi:hypothetical protein
MVAAACKNSRMGMGPADDAATMDQRLLPSFY